MQIWYCWIVTRKGKVVFLIVGLAIIIGNSDLKASEIVKILAIELKIDLYITEMKGKK